MRKRWRIGGRDTADGGHASGAHHLYSDGEVGEEYEPAPGGRRDGAGVGKPPGALCGGGRLRAQPVSYTHLKSNGELVARVVELAKLLGREIATPDEARRILSLK